MMTHPIDELPNLRLERPPQGHAQKQFIKKVLKKLLPGPISWYHKFVAKRHYWDRPRYTAMPYDSQAVLQCDIAYNKYGGYCIPLSSRHRNAVQAILSGDVWEPQTIEFMMSYGGDIIHAGTYFGDFLPALAHSRAGGDKVWAFEPNLENYRCAHITAQINGLRNVELFHAGLSSHRGSVSMRVKDEVGKALGGLSRILPASAVFPPSGTELVDMVSIDEMFPPDRRAAIIQLDIEGFEKQALEGARETIRRCLPILILESVPEKKWLTENILQLGYHVERTIHDNTVLVHK